MGRGVEGRTAQERPGGELGKAEAWLPVADLRVREARAGAGLRGPGYRGRVRAGAGNLFPVWAIPGGNIGVRLFPGRRRTRARSPSQGPFPSRQRRGLGVADEAASDGLTGLGPPTTHPTALTLGWRGVS